MKPFLCLLPILLLLSTAPAGSLSSSNTQGDAIVYICTGEHATSYHAKKSCAEGNCHASVKAVSRSEATRMGRKPCGRCKP